MRYPKAAVLTAAILTATVLWPVTPTAAGAGAGPKWAVVPEVPSANGGGPFRDVTAISSDDVWGITAGSTAHWTAPTWTVVPVPPPPTPTAIYDLRAIDAVAPGNMWAVGGALSITPVGPATETPVILQFDGHAWFKVPNLAPSGGITVLNDVDVLPSGDGWAVGSTTDSLAPTGALILRGPSGQWAPVPVPAVDGTGAELTSVYARSAQDAWAVGSYRRTDGRRVSLVLHWNGFAWKQVVVPASDATADESLTSVAALSATDVWAVGRTCLEGGLLGCRPLVLRLLGPTWQVIPPANAGTEFVEVIPFSASDVWVIGYTVSLQNGESDHVQHWDGVQFTVDTTVPGPGAPAQGEAWAASPQGDMGSAIVAASAAPDASEIWAVGWAFNGATNASHAIRRGAPGT